MGGREEEKGLPWQWNLSQSQKAKKKKQISSQPRSNCSRKKEKNKKPHPHWWHNQFQGCSRYLAQTYIEPLISREPVSVPSMTDLTTNIYGAKKQHKPILFVITKQLHQHWTMALLSKTHQTKEASRSNCLIHVRNKGVTTLLFGKRLLANSTSTGANLTSFLPGLQGLPRASQLKLHPFYNCYLSL